jgi:hypothetical protein
MARFNEMEMDWQSSVVDKDSLRTDLQLMNEKVEQSADRLKASNKHALDFLNEVRMRMLAVNAFLAPASCTLHYLFYFLFVFIFF